MNLESAQTPLIRQYLEIKKDFQDAILFFRLGDFYEMFFEDAQVASKVLDIALTSRDKRSENAVPLCGVPYHSSEGYISRLLDHGYKVAICEQVENPKDVKGIVKREVVRVITPGLRTELEGLPAKESHLLVSVSSHHDGYGLSWFDMASSRFEVCHVENLEDLCHELHRLSPKEVLLPEGDSALPIERWIQNYQLRAGAIRVEKLPSAVYHQAEKKLAERFHLQSLDGLGFENSLAAAESALAIIYFVEDRNKTKQPHLDPPKSYFWKDVLYLDTATREHLEIFQSGTLHSKTHNLFAVIDETVTSVGGRKLKEWMHFPLKNVAAIVQRQNTVEELREESTPRETIRSLLQNISDIERLISKVVNQRAHARDLVALRESLKKSLEIKQALKVFKSELLVNIVDKIDVDSELVKYLEETLVDEPPLSLKDGGMIRPGVSPELDEYKSIEKNAKTWLAQFETAERQKTGITTLKVGYNRIFGYFLEVTKSHVTKVPTSYERRQTLANAERYVTPELKAYEAKILGAEEKIQELELQIFENIQRRVSLRRSSIQKVAQALAEIDTLASLARLSLRHGYVRPKVVDPGAIKIEAGRHPIVEKFMQSGSFIANGIELNHDDQQMVILTGPNMAGKSTIMKQIALIVYLAQLGSFVPAEAAEIGVVDRIFTRVGASDDLAGGRSTFMVEMNETANILRNATKSSLVILDEIGRGTSTYDGLAIAWAVAEDLHDRVECKTIFATHYHEMTELSAQKSKMVNMNVSVKEWQDQIIFIRALSKGAVNRSYGIEVARLAGVPSHVIQSASHILRNLESREKPQLTIQKPEQLSLSLDPEFTSWKADLKSVDLNNTTPLEALRLLGEWIARYRNS